MATSRERKESVLAAMQPQLLDGAASTGVVGEVSERSSSQCVVWLMFHSEAST